MTRFKNAKSGINPDHYWSSSLMWFDQTIRKMTYKAMIAMINDSSYSFMYMSIIWLITYSLYLYTSYHYLILLWYHILLCTESSFYAPLFLTTSSFSPWQMIAYVLTCHWFHLASAFIYVVLVPCLILTYIPAAHVLYYLLFQKML